MNNFSRFAFSIYRCAGWLFIFIIWVLTVFSEELASIAIKNGNLTFLGWCIILLTIAITWLMIRQMLKEICWRTSISVLMAFIIAILMGLGAAMILGTESFLRYKFGIVGLYIMGFIGFGALFLVLIGIGRIILRIFQNSTRK